MSRKRKTIIKRRSKPTAAPWSLTSLGLIVIVLVIALVGLLVMMHNATEQRMQEYGVSEGATLEQLSADMDTIDVDVLDAQTQLLPTD